MKVAIVRGAFLNQYEIQSFVPLAGKVDISLFSSLNPMQTEYGFPLIKLPSPMDIPFGIFGRLKMPILNRLLTDAHWLYGLENKLSGFDIAHCAETYYAYTHQCLAAKRSGKVKKVVSTVWENIPFNNEGVHGRKDFKQDAIRNVDHFLAVSEKAKEALTSEGADEKKISVVSPGIDTERFKPVDRNGRKVITILFCGRLEKIKGVEEIILAAKELLSDRELKTHKCKFVFCGQGSERQNLELSAGDLRIANSVEFTSADYEQIPQIYRQADIFVAPSKESPTWKEQYGMVLAEAQASGLPVITTNTGSIPETVGKAAVLIDPGDHMSLYHEIKNMVLNPKLRKHYGERARRQAMSHNIGNQANAIEMVYKRTLGMR